MWSPLGSIATSSLAAEPLEQGLDRSQRRQRSFLGLIVFLTGALAVAIVLTAWRVHFHLALIARIEAAKGSVESTSLTSSALISVLGPHRARAFDRIDQVDWPGATDDDVALLHQWPSISALDIGSGRLTHKGLHAIAHLPNLRRLWLHQDTLDDASIDLLASLEGLELVSLGGTPVSSEGVKRLSRLRGIRILGLHSTGVADDAMPSLAEMPRLSQLILDNTAVTDEGLRQLSRSSSLRSLSLKQTKITDAGVLALGQMQSLEAVNLDSTSITSHGLQPILALPRLRFVSLAGITIDDETRQSFSRKLGRYWQKP